MTVRSLASLSRAASLRSRQDECPLIVKPNKTANRRKNDA